LIAYKTQDDDFDTDFGYAGNVQFGIALRDSAIADISTSEAFESDNDGKGSTLTPKTTAVFSNMTAIGPRIDAVSGKGNSLFRAGAHIRRNTGISIMNSIIAGWPVAIQFDASTGTAVDKNIDDSTIRMKNVTLAGNTANITYTKSGTPTANDATTLLTWFSTPAYGNTILTAASADRLKLIQPFNYTNPDFTPYANNSTPSTTPATPSTDAFTSAWGTLGTWDNVNFTKNGDFKDAKLQAAFFDKTATFRGAVATSGENQTWWKGWTIWK
jgi:hypothetical protein